jgi:Undecaprenyl-phosphate glucose phosphotransferase
MDGGSDPRRAASIARKGTASEIHPMHQTIIFASDAVVAMLLGFISGSCYLRMMHAYTGVNLPLGPLWREVMLGSVISALVMRESRLGHNRYDIERAFRYQLPIARGAIIVIVLFCIGLLTRSLHDLGGLWLLSWAALLASWIGLSRLGLSRYWGGRAGRREQRERVVVIGASGITARLAEQLTEDADVVIIVTDLDAAVDRFGQCTSIVDLLGKAGSGAVDTVILALNPGDPVDVEALLRQLQSVPVQIAFCANLQKLPLGTRALRTLGGVTLAVVAGRPSQRWDLAVKAILDRGGACVLMMLTGPLFLAAAIAIACDSPGPVIFRQTRSGWGGCQFTVYKFRTMRHRSDVASRHQTVRNDPRCTRVGAFLRRTSLDELPQLWNVICGDMSLVGPRPHADMLHMQENTASAICDEYAQRYRVKPGMTGWAQIHGLRGALENEEQLRKRIKLDLYYIDHWSIWLDIKILARTPYAVLAAENAF